VQIGLTTVIIVALLFSCFYSHSQAETRQSFTPSDKFNIPQLNGTISFAFNGSYSSAKLNNDTWTFNDLRFNISRPLGTLKVSTENSNMTIYSYQAINFFGRSVFLRYNVNGVGRQTVNLGLNVSKLTSSSEWSVTIPGPNGQTIFLAENEGWNLLPDNTVVVTGITGNLSVVHYNFGVNIDNNLPFYQAHSIAIITGIVLASTVAVAAVIKVKVRKD
ncbi:MAG TPA: hypothetical protein VF350_06840, partial [Candidatus Bathyarchaeia archaeon]